MTIRTHHWTHHAPPSTTQRSAEPRPLAGTGRLSARICSRVLLAAAAAALVLGGLTACAPGGGSGNGGYAGAELASPLAEPAIDLTDTSSKPYDLNSATRGKLTLIYFGYTHCPDVCPTTMADLAAALRQLTAVQRSQVAVVFITSDPVRDTPRVVRSWLDNFSAAFIGLTGPITTIDRYANQLGIPLEPPVKGKGGVYEVTHGAQVLAFSPSDQKARVVWLPGTSIAGYAQDIRKLLST